MERGSQIETAPVWCCWANDQMDWTVHVQQESKSPDKATPEPLWCSEEYITTANYRLQQALQMIESWAQSWLVKVNFHNLQSLQPEAQCALETKWAYTTPGRRTYISRLTLDRRLTWKNQIQKNQARSKIRLALMKKSVTHRVGC